MLSRICNLSAITIMLLVLGLQGCAIGIYSVDTPEVPSPRPLSLGEVTFDICDPNSNVRKGWAQRVEPVLLRDFGLQARSGKPLGNKPFFHFLVTPMRESEDFLGIYSWLLSFFTLSAIPGYFAYDSHFNIQLSAMDANGVTTTGDYFYQYRQRVFLWAPLILYPDFIGTINGGYENPDKNNHAKEQIIRKFVLDAAEQLHKASEQEGIGRPLPPLDCPVSRTE